MVWSHVHDLTGRDDLKTLAQGKPFRVKHVDNRRAYLVIESSGQSRIVQRKEIESAWDHLVREGKLTAVEIQDNKYAQLTSAHVAAILATVPGVDYVTKPVITLYLRRKPEKKCE